MFLERFNTLPAYAFPRLRALLDVHAGGGEVVHMTIGEPKHPFPAWIGDIIAENVGDFGRYPPNAGTPELRQSICDWVMRRYGVPLAVDTQVCNVNGTREALYNAAMALIPELKNGARPIVAVPNPFYQVYAVAAVAVGAETVFVPATRKNGYLPDYAGLGAEVLNRVAVAYVCSPSNPQGAVASREYWAALIGLAEKYDFQIFADECYSEIYRDERPVGALQVAHEMGADPERVLIFHSLSKQSNLPGLRSGFVAGGPQSLHRIKKLRDFSGAPLPLQYVSARVWDDEEHVVENRRLYREKYVIADEIMGELPGYRSPEAGFFLWLPVEDGEATALKLWKETGVRVLPGAYLSRDVNGSNPGASYIRVAMVAPKNEMRRGLLALRDGIHN
jgi:aspartate/methionine/tyrosine aminotransferase